MAIVETIGVFLSTIHLTMYHQNGFEDYIKLFIKTCLKKRQIVTVLHIYLHLQLK